MTATASTIVDVHTHFMPITLMDVLRRRKTFPHVVDREGDEIVACSERLNYTVPKAMVSFDEQLAQLDASCTDLALLTPGMPGLDWAHPPECRSLARDINDELLELCASNRKLEALVLLPAQDTEGSAEELERAKARGAQGAILFSNVAGRGLHEPQFDGIFRAAEELDMVLLLHPTTPRFSSGISRNELVSVLAFVFDSSVAAVELVLSGIFARYPLLKLVLVHAGGILPCVSGRLAHLLDPSSVPGGREDPIQGLKRLYVDIASAAPDSIRHALSFFGDDRVMFGSDAPFWQSTQVKRTLGSLDLPETTRASIEHGTAVRVFGIEREALTRSSPRGAHA